MSYFQRLAARQAARDSLLCVGLDPDPARETPPSATERLWAIIAATSDLACAYKPNLACYEALGREGFAVLERVRAAIPADIPVVADAKRGDVGHTAAAYARAWLREWGFDAMTVSPYLGDDAVEPFLAYTDKGVYVLCHTSNPGAGTFQELPVQPPAGKTEPLYLAVADRARAWNGAGNVGLVVGATFARELELVRERCPDLPFLVPGIGAQGGDLRSVQAAAAGAGCLITASRSICYPEMRAGEHLGAAARAAARELRDRIRRAQAGQPW